jgi:hypothetical protein
LAKEPLKLSRLFRLRAVSTQNEVLPMPASQLKRTDVGERTSVSRSSGGVKVQAAVSKVAGALWPVLKDPTAQTRQ